MRKRLRAYSTDELILIRDRLEAELEKARLDWKEGTALDKKMIQQVARGIKARLARVCEVLDERNERDERAV